jgi:hypothetical protein
MRGYKDFNFPAFFEAEKFLTEQGVEVINPARQDVELGFDPTKSLEEQPTFLMDDFIRRDIEAIMSLNPKEDLLFLLDGWDNSQGARAEKALADWRGLQTVPYTQVSKLAKIIGGFLATHRN